MNINIRKQFNDPRVLISISKYFCLNFSMVLWVLYCWNKHDFSCTLPTCGTLFHEWIFKCMLLLFWLKKMSSSSCHLLITHAKIFLVHTQPKPTRHLFLIIINTPKHFDETHITWLFYLCSTKYHATDDPNIV